MIPFNKPYMTRKELWYISQAHANGHLAGNGQFSKKCCAWLENRIGSQKALLTHSCTAALEAAALGIAHPLLGQAIVVVATASAGAQLDTDALIAQCRLRLPAYTVPAMVRVRDANLPRNANGKIDRKLLAQEMQDLFEGAS